MKGNQDAPFNPGESGRPVSSVVAVQNPPRNGVSLRELGEAVSRGFWDVDEAGEIAVARPASRPRPTILPKPLAAPGSPQLWQVGIVLDSEELTQLWLQQGQLNDETTFVWSKYGHTWLPLRAVPELQRVIGQAQREEVERSRALPPLLPVPPVVPALAPAPNGTSALLTGTHARHSWVERVRSFVRRQTAWTDQAAILLSRDANWIVRKRALVAVSRNRGAQGLIAALVSVFLLFGMLLHVSHGKYRAEPPELGASRTGMKAPSIASTPAVLSPSVTTTLAATSASAPTISIESLPLVSKGAHSFSSHAAGSSAPVGVKAAQITLASEPATEPSNLRLPFDVAAARRSLDYAATRTRHCTNGEMSGSVVVTFQPSGAVQDVAVSSIVGNAANMSCVVGMFRSARVAPFGGGPIAVKKSFRVTH